MIAAEFIVCTIEYCKIFVSCIGSACETLLPPIRLVLGFVHRGGRLRQTHCGVWKRGQNSAEFRLHSGRWRKGVHGCRVQSQRPVRRRRQFWQVRISWGNKTSDSLKSWTTSTTISFLDCECSTGVHAKELGMRVKWKKFLICIQSPRWRGKKMVQD